MGAALGLLQVELGAADDDLVAEIHKDLQDVLQAHRHRAALDQGDVVDGEAGLEFGVFEQGVQDDIGIGALLDADDDPQTLAGTFVVDVGNAVQTLVFDHLADLFDHGPLVDHVRDLGHDDGLTAVVGHFDLGLGPYDDASAAGLVGVPDTGNTLDDAAGREIRALDVLHQFLGRDLGIVDIGADGVTAFGKVVRGHVRRHTDGDTGRAVEQQERRLGRKDRRLFDRIVEVQGEVYRVLVQVGKHLFGQLVQFGFGVSHGRDRVSVHGTEVALSPDQRITLVPVLGETGHGVIYARVAVRVELTQHLADDSRRLLGLARVAQAEAVHPEQDPALNRLQAVPGIRERTRYDDGHRVIDVRRTHLLVDVDLFDISAALDLFVLLFNIHKNLSLRWDMLCTIHLNMQKY